MTPLLPTSIDPAALTAVRIDLLNRSCEFFAPLFGGRIPNEQEKAALVEQAVQNMGSAPVYINDIYTVTVEQCPPFVHLQIHRNDWMPCTDWRHFQLIKNELVGKENEAMELFPAESRLVDTSNIYHLWVHANPGFRFPLGLPHRLVTSDAPAGERQRPLGAERTPAVPEPAFRFSFPDRGLTTTCNVVVAGQPAFAVAS